MEKYADTGVLTGFGLWVRELKLGCLDELPFNGLIGGLLQGYAIGCRVKLPCYDYAVNNTKQYRFPCTESELKCPLTLDFEP